MRNMLDHTAENCSHPLTQRREQKPYLSCILISADEPPLTTDFPAHLHPIPTIQSRYYVALFWVCTVDNFLCITNYRCPIPILHVHYSFRVSLGLPVY
jgi:hypothetical protein